MLMRVWQLDLTEFRLSISAPCTAYLFLSTPEAISYHGQETGSSFMQMSVGEERRSCCCCCSTDSLSSHYLIHQWREGMCVRTVREQVAAEHPLLSVCLLPNLGVGGGGAAGRRPGLSFSLSTSLFLPCSSFSLSEPRPGDSRACTIVLEENCQSRLLWLNTESRSFIKELICYSLPLTHSLTLSSSVLHWLTVPHSSLLSWVFS